LWLHSLKVAQLLRSVACLHTNQSRSYLNHLVCTFSIFKIIVSPVPHIYSSLFLNGKRGNLAPQFGKAHSLQSMKVRNKIYYRLTSRYREQWMWKRIVRVKFQVLSNCLFSKGEEWGKYHDIQFVGQNLKLVLQQNDASSLTTKGEKWNKILCDLRISQTSIWISTYQSVWLLVPDNWNLHQATSYFLQFA